ncbi:MAG: methyl-accepting chemotaxis protein [Ghiorsea sp.]
MEAEHTKELEELFKAVSSGDFTFRVSIKNPLATQANQMLQWLDSMQLKELSDKVELSIAGFESTINMAKLQQLANGVAQRTESMASATEEMSITVQMMAEQASKVGSQSEDAKQSVQQGSKSMQNISEVMSTTTSQMNEVTCEVQRLTSISKEINSLLATIQKISDQTNLLALNATIEAARAGEAGRGFAVVAGEVKQLSHQTKDAAENIVEKSNNIQKSVSTVIERMDSMAKTVEHASSIVESSQASMHAIVSSMLQVDESVQGIHQATSEQSIASTEIAEGVTLSFSDAQEMGAQSVLSLDGTDAMDKMLRSDLQEFSELKITGSVIQLAKSDHMLWKKRLIDMILGRGTIDTGEVTDHRNCRLGKWYYSDGTSQFGKTSAFKKLEQPHADVHALAKKSVAKFNDGDIAGAIKDVELISELSDTVVQYLEQLEE